MTDAAPLPYRIAVLCYLYDQDDRLLLLHRAKSPNAGLYSPIGGKLEVELGEGPHQCAVREIMEETGLEIPIDQVHLFGMVSERAYEGETHWLIFLFEVRQRIDPSRITTYEFDEGTLEWIDVDAVEQLPIPRTDREILWPNVRKHRGGFFSIHIECDTDPMSWSIHESSAD